MSEYVYRKDQELPAIAIEWADRLGAPVAFASGYTFTAKIALATAPSTVLVSKTTGITGADTFPNLTVDFSTTDFSALTAAVKGTEYVVHLYARRTADTKDRVFRPAAPVTFTLYPAPA